MPPVVIAAGIGAAAGIGGAVLSSSAQKKAASKAADSAAQTAASNNALQSQIYNQNSATLNPYVTRGNEAGNAINSLLGISGSTQPVQSTQQYGAPMAANDQPPMQMGINDYGAGEVSKSGFGGMIRNWRGETGYNPQQFSPQQAAQTVQPQTPGTAQNAFQNYLGSTGYQFQVDQGNKAINQGYAARGSLQSGAALKALQTYGQNTATGFFKDYLGLLSNQQGVGLSGANAIAGVGTNYANTVSANNNAMGTAQQNAYLQQGNAAAGTWGSVAGGISGVANAFASSYKPSPPPPSYTGVNGNWFDT